MHLVSKKNYICCIHITVNCLQKQKTVHKALWILYICAIHTVVLLHNFYQVYTVDHNTLIIVKTHHTGDMFRLNNSHHQAYVNVQTITVPYKQNAVIGDRLRRPDDGYCLAGTCRQCSLF
jgi:hypothetical protein